MLCHLLEREKRREIDLNERDRRRFVSLAWKGKGGVHLVPYEGRERSSA